MFTKISDDKVESSTGFEVELISVHEIRYAEGDHVLIGEIEGGRNDKGEYDFAVYTETIRKWEAPHNNEEVSDEKKNEIISRIDAALTFLGIPHIMH